MIHRLEDYLIPIGQVTIASAALEEVVIRWGALLAGDDVADTRYRNLTRGMENNLSFLADRVKERVSVTNQQPVLDMIERARTLKNRRNENIHGVWGEMINADTDEFVKVARSRHEKDRSTRSTRWDFSVPTVAELNVLARDLRAIALELNERIADLWDIDEDIVLWRYGRGY